MRPRLVLGTVAAALALPLVGFVVANANAAERPGHRSHESTQQTPDSGMHVAAPTTPPAGGEGASPRPSHSAQATESSRPAASESESPNPEPSDSARPTRRPSARPTVKPSTRPSRIAKVADSPTGGWSTPSLVVGSNDISAPVMASGRTAAALVACAPSSACTVSGDTLEISGTATSVTVTWSVPGIRTYRGWSAQASL